MAALGGTCRTNTDSLAWVAEKNVRLGYWCEWGEKYFTFYLTRVYVVRIFDSSKQWNKKHLRRFNFFIEQKWIDRLKRDMNKHGHSTVSGFIRMIIIKFFDKNT